VLFAHLRWKCESLQSREDASRLPATLHAFSFRELARRAVLFTRAEHLDELRGPAGLEARFLVLAEVWRRETRILSLTTDKSMHPAYQQIIGMGPRVVPLILRELQRRPDHWFWALWAITGEDPVPVEDAGDVEKMTEAWLQFGRERGWL
jgi:hypothetical protein